MGYSEISQHLIRRFISVLSDNSIEAGVIEQEMLRVNCRGSR